MQDWIKELRDKIVSLRNNTYGFAHSNFESTDFQIWYEKINEIFKEYKFGNKLYEEEFNKLKFRNKEFTGKAILLNKPIFDEDLEKSRIILTKIIQDIDIYDEKFVKLKKEVKEKIIYVKELKPMKCFLIDTPTCNKKIIEQPTWVFQSYDYKDKDIEKAIINGINPILSNYNLIPKPAKDFKKRHDYMCKICQMIQESKFFLADLSNPNTSVGIELGLAFGTGKETILMTNKNPNETSDLKRNELIIYSVENISKLQLDFLQVLQDLLRR